MWQTQYLFFDNLHGATRAQRSSSSEVNIVERPSRWLKLKPRPLSFPEPLFVFIPVAPSSLSALPDLDCSVVSDPMDCSPPGSSVYETLQASILEWIASSFSRGSFLAKDWTWVSPTTGSFCTIWATREAPWIEAMSPKLWPFHVSQSSPLLSGAESFSLRAKETQRLLGGHRTNLRCLIVLWFLGAWGPETRFSKNQETRASRAPSSRGNAQEAPLTTQLFLAPSSVSESKQFKELPKFIVSACSNFDKIHCVMWRDSQPALTVSQTHNAC